jgi:hypothetical protein
MLGLMRVFKSHNLTKDAADTAIDAETTAGMLVNDTASVDNDDADWTPSSMLPRTNFFKGSSTAPQPAVPIRSRLFRNCVNRVEKYKFDTPAHASVFCTATDDASFSPPHCQQLSAWY